jgi:hypothetical protein
MLTLYWVAAIRHVTSTVEQGERLARTILEEACGAGERQRKPSDLPS